MVALETQVQITPPLILPRLNFFFLPHRSLLFAKCWTHASHVRNHFHPSSVRSSAINNLFVSDFFSSSPDRSSFRNLSANACQPPKWGKFQYPPHHDHPPLGYRHKLTCFQLNSKDDKTHSPFYLSFPHFPLEDVIYIY